MSSDQRRGLFRLALGEDDDADGGDEQEDAEYLEGEVVVGEKRVTDEVDIGEFSLGERGGDFASEFGI